MTSPMDPRDDRDLESRLQASWHRAVARAEHDLKGRDLASTALVTGRHSARSSRTRVALVLAAFALVAVALLVGQRITDRVASTAPTPQPSPVPASPAPSSSAGLDEEVIPILDPGQTFPPSVDGQAVVQVGPEADARIAAATDDSPIYVSGWLTEAARPWNQCATDFLGPDCIDAQLSATATGGASLRILSTVSRHPGLGIGPALAMPVLVQIHVHDPACDAADCARTAVLDRVVIYGAERVAPELLANTLPAGGITAEQAVEIARGDVRRQFGSDAARLTVLQLAAAPDALLEGSRGSQPERWLWRIHLVSDDGRTEYDTNLDFMDGMVLGTGRSDLGKSRIIYPPQSFPPSTVDGNPVVAVGPEADARIAAATDDSSFYVSGWLLGSDRTSCVSAPGTPAPDGVHFEDCTARLLRATAAGGASLPVFSSRTGANLALQDPQEVVPVVVEVHVHDHGCADATCVSKAVLDRVVDYGPGRIAPAFLATQPANGISLDAAIAVARGEDIATFGEPLVLLSVQAGPYGLLRTSDGTPDPSWVWAVDFVSNDGYRVYTAYVDFRSGGYRGSTGGSIDEGVRLIH